MYMIKKSRYSTVHVHRVLYDLLEIQYFYVSPIVCLIILLPLTPFKKLAQNISVVLLWLYRFDKVERDYVFTNRYTYSKPPKNQAFLYFFLFSFFFPLPHTNIWTAYGDFTPKESWISYGACVIFSLTKATEARKLSPGKALEPATWLPWCCSCC